MSKWQTIGLYLDTDKMLMIRFTENQHSKINFLE